MKGFHHTRLFGHIEASKPTTAGRRVDRYALAQGQTCEDPRPVLVAVDGSKAGWEALDWAAAEAAARRCELGVVHEFAWPLSVDSFGVLHARAFDPATVGAAEALMAEAVRRAHQVAPEVDVDTHLQIGARTSGIRREAEECALMVLGRHQPRGVLGRRWDRSQHIPRRAPCPVAVVGLSHGVVAGRSAARVIVGVDHPRDSASALGIAFRAARRRGLGVTVLHVWSPRGQPGSDGWGFDGWADEPPGSELAKRRRLDALLPEWREAFPDVEIRQRLIRGPVGPVLVAESDSAALLVLGSRGRKSLRTGLLGSVTRTVSRSAHCPVAVVRRSPGADGWGPR